MHDLSQTHLKVVGNEVVKMGVAGNTLKAATYFSVLEEENVQVNFDENSREV